MGALESAKEERGYNVKRWCKGSVVGWGGAGVLWAWLWGQGQAEVTPTCLALTEEGTQLHSRDSQGRLRGGGVRMHTVMRTARHSLQCPVDPGTELLGLLHSL